MAAFSIPSCHCFICYVLPLGLALRSISDLRVPALSGLVQPIRWPLNGPRRIIVVFVCYVHDFLTQL